MLLDSSGALPAPLSQAIDRLQASAALVVQTAITEFYAIHPDLHLAHGYEGVRRWRDDTQRHLQTLIAALRAGTPASFADYARSYAEDMRARGQDPFAFGHLLELIGQTIREQLGDEVWVPVHAALDAALRQIPMEGKEYTVALPSDNDLMPAYFNAVLSGNRVAAQDLVFGALDRGATIRQLYLNVFQPALYDVGQMWASGRLSVAQEHLATAITQTILAGIYARVPMTAPGQQRAIVACLAGNYHEIGPRMLADFLQMAGYDTRFLGANTPTDSLLAMIDDVKPDVVGLASTTQEQVDQVKDAIERIRGDFQSYRPTIMVGGLAFNAADNLWRRVGGDVWGMDAGQAIDHLVGSADW
jgi:methanogenic corrinoid protein MtbC1